ncbi:MAG: PKD domain-containing protein, partial [Flavobacteriales bacterium]|nr:PKD domain-containing protein [Flavobacteriales bacterium]
MRKISWSYSLILTAFSLALALSSSTSRAQCPNILDGGGLPSANPVWVSCSGLDFNLFVQPVDTLFSYSIDWGDASPFSTGDTLLPSAFETHLYSAAMANYTVTITANCGVITGTVIMEITPSASIQIPVGSPTFGCAPSTYAFENASTNVSTNTIFTWDWGDGSPIETYGDTNFGDTLYHMYLPGTVGCDVMITLTAANNCPPISTNTYFPILVWEVDDAEVTPDATLLCYPDTIVHYDNTTTKNCFANGNTSQRYEYWNFGDYWGLGYDSIIPWQPWDPPALPGYDIAYPGLGTYTVMLIDSGFCGLDTAYATITIVADPVAALVPNPDTICVGQSIVFSNLSVGANSYSWNFGDGGGWIGTGGGSQTNTYSTPGSFTVNLVASISGTAGCIDTAGVLVEVLPSPQAIFSESSSSACDSLDITFTDASISAVAWAWDFGNGDTSTSVTPPVISYTSPGAYSVKLVVTSANGCKDSTTSTITIYETPVVSFSAPNVCVNQITSFADGSTAGAEPITSWSWDFGDGNTSTVQNPTTTYLAAGPQNVVLVVSTGFCSATDSVVVQADTLPVASVTIDTADGCTPLTVAFSNLSTGAVSYQWDFADGGSYSGFDTAHIFLNGGTSDTVYQVRLIATTISGCMDTVFVPITVHPIPLVAFTSNAAPGCSPLQVSFTDASIGVSQYYWDFGDGTTDTVNANPNHSFVNTTTFILVDTVQLIGVSTFGCADSSSVLVTIYPSANTVIAVPDTGCSPMTVQFSSTLIGAVVFDWDFGDGFVDSVQAPIHTFVNPSLTDTTYTVRLIVTSGFLCVDTSYTSIVVHPKPLASYAVDTTVGCAPLVVTFSNSSSGAVSYDWNFGDGDTSDTAVASFPHTYTNTSGVSIINNSSLVVTNSFACTDTMMIPIEVYPSVFASFTLSDTAGCSPLPVTFSNTSTFGNIYNWNYGDGFTDSIQNPSHTFVNPSLLDTTYTVSLVVTSGFSCTDTATVPVLVYAKPVSIFSVDTTQGCGPVTINFSNTSLSASTFNWDFGNGDTSATSAPNFTHPYTNTSGNDMTYPVTLIVSTINNCSDTMTISLEIFTSVFASFTQSDTAGCSPLSVSFTNGSSFDDLNSWDFGDGSALNTASNPVHIFSNTDTADTSYIIRLIIQSNEGCFDSAFGQVTIYPTPTAAFAATPMSQVFPNTTVNLANLSGAGTWNYAWDWGDGNQDNTFSPAAHDYPTWNNYTIELIVYSDECSDTTDTVVTIIQPPPLAGFALTDTAGCRSLNVTFSNTTLYADSVMWDFGDGTPFYFASDTLSIVHTYYNAGVYAVALTAFGFGGPPDTEPGVVEVYELPIASFAI